MRNVSVRVDLRNDVRQIIYHEKSQLNTLVWGERERAPIIRNAEVREDIALVYANQMAAAECRLPSFVIIILTVSLF